MEWRRPEFTEIKMDAEISSYQEEGEPPPDRFHVAPRAIASRGTGPTVAPRSLGRELAAPS